MKALTLKQKAVEAAKAIRKKFAIFKKDRAQAQQIYHTTHKQLIAPLEELKTLVKTEKNVIDKFNIKKEIKKEDEEEEEESNIKQEQDAYEESEDEEYAEIFKDYDELPRHFAILMSRAGANIDRSRYALHYYSNTDTWKVAHSIVTIIGKDLEVKGTRYEGTPGLYALLTFKQVDNLDKRDIQSYRDIITSTNAHRVKYSAKGKIVSNNSWKFKNILQPYFKKKGGGVSVKKGKGILKNVFKLLNTKNTEYRFWRDPSELVQRMRLLTAAKKAGNNNKQNKNEYYSAVSQLEKEGIIKVKDWKKMRL